MDRYLLVSSRCALAAVLLVSAPSLHAETHRLVATLTGANEPAGGDTNGTGSFSVEIDSEAGDFCYLLSVSGIGRATGAHLHSGAAGTSGEALIPLEVTGPNMDMCAAIEPDKLRPILENPGNYYINVHTAANPDGAIRGQLERR